ncbi:hypothetical protein J6590_015087 [Homalodisca vitripennis]|nr:hypothetical protein J6590_015087 [Homalodisca vitripennis]
MCQKPYNAVIVVDGEGAGGRAAWVEESLTTAQTEHPLPGDGDNWRPSRSEHLDKYHITSWSKSRFFA